MRYSGGVHEKHVRSRLRERKGCSKYGSTRLTPMQRYVNKRTGSALKVTHLHPCINDDMVLGFLDV